jgi:hypothetical protein
MMHIKFSYSHKFNIYLQQVIQQKLAKGGRGLGPPLEGLLPPSVDILGALALIGPPDHDHHLPPVLLLQLLLGLVLFPLELIYRASA